MKTWNIIFLFSLFMIIGCSENPSAKEVILKKSKQNIYEHYKIPNEIIDLQKTNQQKEKNQYIESYYLANKGELNLSGTLKIKRKMSIADILYKIKYYRNIKINKLNEGLYKMTSSINFDKNDTKLYVIASNEIKKYFKVHLDGLVGLFESTGGYRILYSKGYALYDSEDNNLDLYFPSSSIDSVNEKDVMITSTKFSDDHCIQVLYDDESKTYTRSFCKNKQFIRESIKFRKNFTVDKLPMSLEFEFIAPSPKR